MKKHTSEPLGELTVDVLDYMFVEWLVRRSLYSKFAENLAHHNPDSKNPRSTIRDLIREVLSSPAYEPSHLISYSFPFRCTPEGFHFWIHAHYEWSFYLKSFSKIII